MIEQRRSKRDLVMGSQDIARLEIAKFYFCLENLYWYWKPGRAHELSHNVFDAVRRHQIACPDANPIVLAKKWREERQAGNVIKMTMRDEDIDVAYFLVLKQLDAERSQSRAGVKNEDAFTATNFDAWRVAAITHCCRARAGNASSDSPEPHPHRSL